jgi:hypothetical protein
MPSYDSANPKGNAGLFARSADRPFTDPIADLLQQVENDIELESSPDRQRAESRLADHRLAEQVRFEMTLDRAWDGVAYHQLFNDLWTYVLPVIKAFLKRNQMGRLLERYAPERVITMRSEDMFVLRNSDDERTELALDIIATAVENFRDRAIGKHQWKASMRNASMRTYFIGTCAFVYPARTPSGPRRAAESWSCWRASTTSTSTTSAGSSPVTWPTPPLWPASAPTSRRSSTWPRPPPSSSSGCSPKT